MIELKLPKDWKWVKLGELCDVVTGTTPPKSDSSNYGNDIPFFKPPHLWDGMISETEEMLSKKGSEKARIVPPNTVLVTCIGNLGRTGFVKKKAAFNQQINAILENESIGGKYIFYQTQSPLFKKQLEKLATGTTVSIVNKSNFETIDIPLPPKLTQQAIVAKIEELFSELDKGIENLRTAQQQLKTYRQSVLKWAFEGKLTDEWREKQINLGSAEDLLKQIQKDKEIEATTIGKTLKPTNSLSAEQIENLPTLPKSWRWVSLGEIISDLTDYHANGSYVNIKENVQLLDVPDYAIMIRATNFEKENFKTDLKYITEHAYNFLSRSKLFGGEILIGKIGNAGRVYFMPYLNKPASLAMNLFALRFNTEVNKYIHYHLLSSFSKQEISNYVKGVGNPTIDKASVRSLSIALPSFEEQLQAVQEIESRLSVADKMDESIAQSLQQAEALRQSILKKAFDGKLVVTRITADKLL